MLHGQLDIALRDLAFVLDIDSNHDSSLTWGEVKAHRGQIERYALAGMTIKGDGLTCQAHSTDQKIDEHNDGAYDVILFDAVCDKVVPSRLTIVYTLFEDVDPYHRGIVTIHAGHRVPASCSARKHRSPRSTCAASITGASSGASSSTACGISGPDRTTCCSSCRCCCRRCCIAVPRESRNRHWHAGLPVPKLSRAMIELIKVVSGFTVSHSVTLTLSVLGYVNLPSRLVESGIALSIIVAAANNLHPIGHARAWVVAFAFGFIHGLGFASALAGLSLPPTAMAISLGGFSLGVELGQESIVLPFLPLAFLLRRTRFYQVGVLRWGHGQSSRLPPCGWSSARSTSTYPAPGFSRPHERTRPATPMRPSCDHGGMTTPSRIHRPAPRSRRCSRAWMRSATCR